VKYLLGVSDASKTSVFREPENVNLGIPQNLILKDYIM
jgi:hypothetical protein